MTKYYINKKIKTYNCNWKFRKKNHGKSVQTKQNMENSMIRSLENVGKIQNCGKS